MFDSCSKGVAVDFISRYVDFRNRDVFYAEPEVVFKFCKSLTKRIILRSDYMPFEFCVYLYKDDSKTKNNVFIEFSEALKEPKRKKLL